MDYRKSHLADDKGATYEACFKRNSHRAMIWRIERQVLDSVVRTYFTGQDFRLLDFACGTGRVLCHLESRASESTGVDVSPSMLEETRRKVTSSRVLEGDITQSDVLEGETFDLITAFRFFPNAEAELRRDAMDALVRCLSPDGHLVFNNHKHDRASVVRLARLLGRSNARDSDMSQLEVSHLVDDAGLEVVKRYHIGVLPVTETHPVFPTSLLYLIEKPLTWFPPMQQFARYHVYVCRKKRGTK